MDPTAFAIIALILGLAIGGGAGWYFGSRPVAEAKAKAAEREEEFKRSVAELGEAQIKIATLEANAANFDKQMAQMKEAREEMLAQFKAVGGEVLSKSQEAFLKRAEERFKQSEEAGEQKIKALLNPVGERLKKYEEQVEALEQKRVDAFGQLTGLIQSMREGQEEVRRLAASMLGDARICD